MLWEYAVEGMPSSSGFFQTGNIDSPTLAARLNQYGELGWELVTSYPTAYAEGGTHLLVFIYKRPKPPAPPVVASH